MIYDRIDRLQAYWGIDQNLDHAISFALHFDETAADKGEICPGVTYTICTPQLTHKEAPEAAAIPYRAPASCMELHCALADGEDMRCGPVEAMIEPISRNADGSVSAPDNANWTTIHLLRGYFALYFPWDARQSGLMAGDSLCRSRKLVIRIQYP